MVITEKDIEIYTILTQKQVAKRLSKKVKKEQSNKREFNEIEQEAFLKDFNNFLVLNSVKTPTNKVFDIILIEELKGQKDLAFISYNNNNCELF